MGERTWNADKNNWEVDDEPVTYRVTWKNVDDSDEHVKDFTNIDHGYDFYQDLQKSADSYGATWEHVDPE